LSDTDSATSNPESQQSQSQPQQTIEPEAVTINVDKKTLDLIREKMEDKYNMFWGDVIDEEQKRTIELADKLTPGQPFSINGKDYEYKNLGMKVWREFSKLKSKADKEKDRDAQEDMLIEYYSGMLKHCFGMSEEEVDNVPTGEARMIVDAAAYRVLHPVPLHPERLSSGSMQGHK
jgi:hypothetical protein